MNIELKKFAEIVKFKKSLTNYVRYKSPIINLLIKETNFLNINSSIRERLYYIENNINEIVKCNSCNNKAYWSNRKPWTYNKYCSSCAKKSNDKIHKTKNTKFLRYKDENYTNHKKRKLTSLKKYGDENYNNREKAKSTMLRKYGGIGNGSDIIKEKQKQTCIDKYGVPCSFQIEKNRFKLWKNKIKHDNLNDAELSKIYELIKNPNWLRNQFNKKSICEISKELGVRDLLIFDNLVSIGEIDRQSKEYRSHIEKNFYDFIHSIYSGEILKSTRKIIPPLELDFYIPKYKLAIEMNGLYWHSELAGRDKNYHLNKTLKCQEKSIQLLHIFENEWIDPAKQDIWKSIIINRLGRSRRIFARKCEIGEVSSKEARKFQFEHHAQSEANSSIRIGLYYRDELVSLMTFGKPRYNKRVDWELIRFCNKKYYSVIGGASKCFSYFKKRYGGKIISYADLRRSNGNLYKQLGFKLARTSEPNYFYFENNSFNLFPRIKFQKHKLSDELNTFNPILTEWENMQLNGWNRIFDCGNQVWEIK